MSEDQAEVEGWPTIPFRIDQSLCSHSVIINSYLVGVRTARPDVCHGGSRSGGLSRTEIGFADDILL